MKTLLGHLFDLAPLGKVLSLTVAFTLCSNVVHSEWVLIDKSDALGGVETYVDPQSIKKENAFILMLTLFDFKTTQYILEATSRKALSSTIVQDEFDCDQKRYRRLKGTGFSENMGKGNVMFTRLDSSSMEWRSLTEITNKMLEFACKK